MNTMTKRKITPKEPVRLRMRKLKSGSRSLYLDYYCGGCRRYEYLRLYLVPGRDACTRRQNHATLAAALAAKAQRTIDLLGTRCPGALPPQPAQTTLGQWLAVYCKRQAGAGRKDRRIIEAVAHIVELYAGPRISLAAMGRRFCQGYIDFLLTRYHTHAGRPLARNTAYNYYRALNTALNAAVREGLIHDNPFGRLCAAEKIRRPDSQRPYLVIDEIKALIATPAPSDEVKRAFLLACFCGLRISDIRQLTWDNIVRDSRGSHIDMVTQKTHVPLYLPLSAQAAKWLPAPRDGMGSTHVFVLPSSPHVNSLLRAWAARAGIAKHISFHVSRHSFATLMLTLGADLYTTSKLLGHTDVRMTQTYARIVNEKKVRAVNLVDGLF